MIFFPRHKKLDLKRRNLKAKFTVRGHTMSFNTELTRWLEVYLDTRLLFKAHKNLTLRKARGAESEVRRKTLTRGLVTGLFRKIQVVVVEVLVWR